VTDASAQHKVELHCHLLGVIDPPLLAGIRDAGGQVLVDPDLLQRVWPVADLGGFLRWLEILRPYQTAPPALMRPILAAHVARLIAQRVAYAEIMVSPVMFPRERRAQLRALHDWREWTLELEAGRIQIEYIMVLPRTLADDALARDTAALLDMHRAGLIAGVALVGVETGESIRRFSEMFARCRDAGLGIEIHAGEHRGPESVRDALVHGQPHRIGHGLSAFADASLLQEIQGKHIHLEFCPTSNLRTGAIADLSRHPLQVARARGLSYSINTDDPGAFACSLDGEFEALSAALALGPSDFEAVYGHAMAARFQPKLRHGPVGFSASAP